MEDTHTKKIISRDVKSLVHELINTVLDKANYFTIKRNRMKIIQPYKIRWMARIIELSSESVELHTAVPNDTAEKLCP